MTFLKPRQNEITRENGRFPIFWPKYDKYNTLQKIKLQFVDSAFQSLMISHFVNELTQEANNSLQKMLYF